VSHEADRHRDAILGRRAIFLTTALAAIGCSTTKDPGPHGQTPTATTPPVTGPAITTRTVVTPGLHASWDKVMQQAPPLDVPAKATAKERSHLESLKTSFEPKYEAVRQVWLLVPKCDPADEGCASWKQLAGKAKSMYDATRGRRFGSCGHASGRTGFVAARQQAHHAYVASLIKQLEADLGRLAEGYGKDGGEAWARMLEDAQKPPPMPCLSPCRRPDVEDITVNVPFAKDDASLREADSAVAQALRNAMMRQQNHGTKATLVVRGHVDASEAKGDALAAERARAVAQWLVAKGIPAADVKTATMGSHLPIASGGDGSANRRVDFEVVPR